MSKTERRNFIKAAKNLCYSEEVIKLLEQAETKNQCIRIMNSARKNLI